MERLSALDSSFLRVETPTAHMHVGWLAMLRLDEGQRALNVERLRSSLASRLHLAPRFRRRLVEAPVGEPFLADDLHFEIRDHVVDGGPATRSPAQLRQLTGEFLSTQLDRGRPLWQVLVIPRVQGGRAAVLGKVHHALVDGVAAVELGTLLFDLSPEAPPREEGAAEAAADWQPAPEASPAQVLLDAVADTALEQFRTAGRLAALGLRPRASARVADTVRRAAFQLAEKVARPAPPSYLNGRIGPGRALLTRSVSLGRLERIKLRYHGKLNDVVLAVTAGALRRHAALCGVSPQPLRAMVPINVRREGDAPGAGNRIVFGFIDLPVSEPSAARRMRRIQARTAELRRGDQISGAEALLASVGQLPGPLKTRAAHLAASPRLFNLTVSNIPGPQLPLYAAGARVETISPVIPLSEGHSLAVGVLSYGGRMHFALHADPRSLRHVEDLPGLIEEAIRELEAPRRRRPHRGPGGVPPWDTRKAGQRRLAVFAP